MSVKVKDTMMPLGKWKLFDQYVQNGQQNDVQSADGLKTGITIKSSFATGLCDMRANAWGLFARRNIQEGEMKSKMNYRAWSHLCWLIPYMKGTQVIDELNKSKKWSELHIADNCCFHFRRRLLFKMLEDISAREDDESCINQKTEVYFLWKEELEWNESLISRYIGREALWLHRRFLSQCYINYFTIDQGTRNSNGEDFHGVHSTLDDFLDKELELLLHSLDVTDNEFEDTQVQAQHATAYIIWISKQVPPHKHEKLQSRLQEMDLKPIMIKLCADKPHLCESPKLQLHWQHSGGIRQFIKTIVLGFELEPVQRNNSCILG